jgi:hypothetical protein
MSYALSESWLSFSQSKKTDLEQALKFFVSTQKKKAIVL